MALPAQSGPIYLAPASYRRRRLRDAARMLPVFGLVLWLLPILYNAPSTGPFGVYLFGIWFLLILAAAMLARRMGRVAEDAPADRTTDIGP